MLGFVLWILATFYALRSCKEASREIEEKGVKGVLMEAWEGNEPNEPQETPTK